MFEPVSYSQLISSLMILEKSNIEGKRIKYSEMIVKLKKEGKNPVKLPSRSTLHSSGYDLYPPFEFTLKPGESMLLPTGLRVNLNGLNHPSYMVPSLVIMPRSSGARKTPLMLRNTIGLVDADYYGSANEGHIYADIKNPSNNTKSHFTPDKAYLQGIILLTYVFPDENPPTKVRNGGLGSTDK